MAGPALKRPRMAEEAASNINFAENEKDAEQARGPKLQEAIVFHTPDTTMNVMQGMFGNVLLPLTDGGLQYLFAGARASVGVKSGRYAFEFKIVEVMCPVEDPNAKTRTPQPRQQLRVGVSAGGSSLFVGETQDSVCFDSEGFFISGRTAMANGPKFGANTVVAIVLNLEPTGPNASTVSLFVSGQRVGVPRPLPDALNGKALFPTLSFKNVSVQCNFGPELLVPLPFTCHTLHEALQADIVVTPAPPKKNTREVWFPVCLPDEGTFDWLDLFLKKNPSFVELSDRAILKWAEMSGITRPSGYVHRSSNDKPEMGFGVMNLDDHSIRRILFAAAPIQDRDYIVMEVTSNLLRYERREMLAKWASSSFKKRAAVMVSDPPTDLRDHTREVYLKQKQDAANVRHKMKLAEDKRRRDMEKKQRKLDRDKAKAARKQDRFKIELQHRMDFEAKKAETIVAGLEFLEEYKELPPEVEEEDPPEPEEPDVPEEPPPTVQLTDAERWQPFRKPPTPDLASYALNTSFMKFSLPEKDEGFDEIAYDWAKEQKSQQYLKQWKQQLKTTTRIEDIQPGDWFLNKWKDWQKNLQSWHAKQNVYKQLVAKRATEKHARQMRKAAEERLAAENKGAAVVPGATAKPGEALEDKKGDDEDGEAVDFEALDVFAVEDVIDVGDGQPLFSAFGFEDWTMMSLRYELHLLAHSFKKDVSDPDRIGVHVDHLTFYYNKYFKKVLNHKFYGVDTIQDLLELTRDTVFVNRRSKVVEHQLPEEMESPGIFIMLTEEARRDRMARIDLGDQSARLKLAQPSVGMGIAPGATAAAAAATAKMPGIVSVGHIRPVVGTAAPQPAGVTRQAGGGSRPPAGTTYRPPVATAVAGWRPPAGWRG